MLIAIEPPRFAPSLQTGLMLHWSPAPPEPDGPPAQVEAADNSTAPSTPSDLDDCAWLARIQQGDEDAARALVQRLYPTVVKSVRCHLPRQGTVEDLAQTVFAKIFTKLHQFSGLVPLEHWVSKITINTCLSQLTREKARPEARMSDLSEEDHALVQRLLSTDGELPAAKATECRELVDKLMASLKPDERLVITLLHLEERTTQEISNCTGWSISRVKVKAFRARNKMRRTAQRLFRCIQPGEYGFSI